MCHSHVLSKQLTYRGDTPLKCRSQQQMALISRRYNNIILGQTRLRSVGVGYMSFVIEKLAGSGRRHGSSGTHGYVSA